MRTNFILMPFIDIMDLPSREVVKGYVGRSMHTGTLTLMYWSVTAHSEIPIHTHEHQQVAHVLKGKFQLIVDGESRILEPGIIALIPSNVPHGGKAITDCELLDVFQPEREDYKFSSE